MTLSLIVILIFCAELLGTCVGFAVGFTRYGGSYSISPYTNMATAGSYAVLAVYLMLKLWAGKLNCFSGLWGLFYFVNLFMLPLWTMVGASNGFPLVQVAGDVTYSVLHIVYFVIGRAAARNHVEADDKTFRRGMICVGYVYLLLGVALRFLGFGFGVPASFAVALAVVCNSFWGVKYLLVAAPLILMPLAGINRSYLVGTIFTTPVAFPLMRRRFIIMAFLAAVGGVGSYMLFGGDKSEESGGRDIKTRIVHVYEVMTGQMEIERIPSLHQRVYESGRVEEELNKSVFLKVFGYGQGASLDMSDAPDDAVKISAILGGGLVHNIHFMWSAFQFRYGVVGLVLFLLFMVSLAGLAMKVRKQVLLQRCKSIDAFLMVYCLCELGGFLFASNFFFTGWLFAFSVGYLTESRGTAVCSFVSDVRGRSNPVKKALRS